VLDLLADIAKTRLVWIEYGLQSAHDKTLAFVNRGHDVQSFTRAARQTRARGIPVCAHVILGLPGETKADMMETAEYLADVGIDGIKIHLLYVVKKTPLERLYDTGRYQCLSREAYVDITCDFLARLPAHVVVQRLTGDPHPDELAAPSWALEKNRTLSLIHARMEAHDLRQGCRPREKGR
jgi:hypothetical protein